ncbi:MAG: 1-deoxy-D-xylulose-5-phosphate reductoisomerase [Bacteroidetes bacterium]|jgi:1-deoxy-D-xylulose-5-phosphate reductoisomerase|nr:MAG: 1-deoxy-D-xylulose-5-phosphate reductoisomerase [Bacteroidota bacterium]
MNKRKIAIVGSTGSIGTQALEVIRQSRHLQAEVLIANNNVDLLIKQAMEFEPNAVVIIDKSKYSVLKEALKHLPVKVFAGEEAALQVIEFESVDMVLASAVGFAGLSTTIHAIKNKKAVALANKESLVVAGHLIDDMIRRYQVPLIPVDSEHSAIFQCLTGEQYNSIEKIILTASGGPFRGYNTEQLKRVTLEQALKHPNWKMGNKITIDSATLMNKGLEVIEARWLFHLQPSQIEVVVHPQSIIHSMVQFNDGSIKAQMGLPDMKLPIHYALHYPERVENSFERFDFTRYPELTFSTPDTQTFPCLQLAYEALNKGGNHPAALNAANEKAVELFLNQKIRFYQIPWLIEKTLEKIYYISQPDLNELVQTHHEALRIAASLI